MESEPVSELVASDVVTVMETNHSISMVAIGSPAYFLMILLIFCIFGLVIQKLVMKIRKRRKKVLVVAGHSTTGSLSKKQQEICCLTVEDEEAGRESNASGTINTSGDQYAIDSRCTSKGEVTGSYENGVRSNGIIKTTFAAWIPRGSTSRTKHKLSASSKNDPAETYIQAIINVKDDHQKMNDAHKKNMADHNVETGKHTEGPENPTMIIQDTNSNNNSENQSNNVFIIPFS